MSCKLLLDDIENDVRDQLRNDLHIKIENNKYNKFAPIKFFIAYDIDEPHIYIPFAYAHQILKQPRIKRENFSAKLIDFQQPLRDIQKELKKEVIEVLNKTGSVIISAYTGFGKTCLAINISVAIKMKTLILVPNKVAIMKQWKTSIIKFCPKASCQIVETSDKDKKEDHDFYIINALNLSKFDKSYFKDVGTIIVDECHLIAAEVLSKSLQYVTPRYLIGLSATPYRNDGMDPLLDLYFGSNKLIRELYRKHIVYKVNTNFTPTVETAKNGRLNWGVLLDSQCKDTSRNELIIRIVKKYKDRTFLILSKRIDQSTYLINRLKEEKEDVTSLIGTQQEFKTTSRILVATCQKAGVGFDHSSLDSLIIASDLKDYFVQYLGRVFRTETVEPIIFDLVDNNGVLEKHFSIRKKIYIKHGGKITNIDEKDI